MKLIILIFFFQRKRLYELQEQHADLLGLLAQQEVELSVFKSALGSKLGAEVMNAVKQEAEKNVIEMYGTYTDFRKYSLDENNGIGGSV